MSNYYEILPFNYFDNLLAKITLSLTRGENVCISVMFGFGYNTVFDFIRHNLLSFKSGFGTICIYDPEIENLPIAKFVKNKMSTNKNVLVIIRSLEKINNRRKVLESLNSLKRASQKVVFIGIADQSAVLYPQEYSGISSLFFSERIYLGQFDKNQTTKMIDINSKYYGWNTPKSLHNQIYNLSGGIPRLIKYICKEVSVGTEINNIDKLLANYAIAFELDYLTNIIINTDFTSLDQLGITQQAKIKSLLLRQYIDKLSWKSIQKVYPTLSQSESKILLILTKSNENEPVSLDRLADTLSLTDDKYSLWGLYKLISRLKRKIAKQQKIKNVRGRGYILTRT